MANGSANYQTQLIKYGRKCQRVPLNPTRPSRDRATPYSRLFSPIWRSHDQAHQRFNYPPSATSSLQSWIPKFHLKSPNYLVLLEKTQAQSPKKTQSYFSETISLTNQCELERRCDIEEEENVAIWSLIYHIDSDIWDSHMCVYLFLYV